MENVSWRNLLIGKVSAIKRDTITAQVDINIGSYNITAVITRDALEELCSVSGAPLRLEFLKLVNRR